MQLLAGHLAAKPLPVRSRTSFSQPTSTPCRRQLQVRAATPEPIIKDKSSVEKGDLVFNPSKESVAQIQKVEQARTAEEGKDDSIARLYYAKEAEQAVNEQINHEYTMSYVYHQMACYFARDSVALPGLSAFFKEHSAEERGHAQQLMDFQSTRGGRSKLATITAPDTDYNHPEKGDALHAMEVSLALEKLNFQYLYKLHKVADDVDDAQFADFVESMLGEQAKHVKETADFVSQLRRVGKGHGVYQWDKDIMQRPHMEMAQVADL